MTGVMARCQCLNGTYKLLDLILDGALYMSRYRPKCLAFDVLRNIHGATLTMAPGTVLLVATILDMVREMYSKSELKVNTKP